MCSQLYLLYKTQGNNSLLWLSDWGSKYKVHTFNVFRTCPVSPTREQYHVVPKWWQNCLRQALFLYPLFVMCFNTSSTYSILIISQVYFLYILLFLVVVLVIALVLRKLSRDKRYRPWQDSNLQSPDPKSGALSIRPHGLRCWSAHFCNTLCCYLHQPALQ